MDLTCGFTHALKLSTQIICFRVCVCVVFIIFLYIRTSLTETVRALEEQKWIPQLSILHSWHQKPLGGLIKSFLYCHKVLADILCNSVLSALKVTAVHTSVPICIAWMKSLLSKGFYLSLYYHGKSTNNSNPKISASRWHERKSH